MNSKQSSSNTAELCIKGCGFFGSPETSNMCSQCCIADQLWRKLRLEEPNQPHQCDPSVEGSSSTVKNRCESCRKKVGLTGFTCRCGKVLCGTHRFPKEHSCTFDFKKADREILAKQFVLIKPDKLVHRI